MAGVLLACVPLMRADVIYTLTADGCSGGCGQSPYGTVTLNRGTDEVLVSVTLSHGENFAGTGAGDALEFNVAGNPVIQGITNGFGVGPAPDTASAFGTFKESVTCVTCQGGKGPAGPLQFFVALPGLTVNDFIANSKGYYFSSDIGGANGRTGNVAANQAPIATPEPASIVLLGAGLVVPIICRCCKRIEPA